MKRLLFLFFLGFSVLTLHSQNYHLSNEARSNEELLYSEMGGIAKQVLKDYKNNNKERYYSIKATLELLSDQFKEGLVSVDSLREVAGTEYPDEAPMIASHYALYAKGLAAGDTSFEKLYTKAFKGLYDPLTEFAKLRFPNNFRIDIKEQQEKIDEAISDLKDKDSISKKEFIKLSRLVLNKKIADTSNDIIYALLQKEDEKRYQIWDSVSVKTKGGEIISLKIAKQKEETKKLPTILIYDIYPGKNGFRYNHLVKEAAYYGYVGVVASTRGKRYSSSEIEPFEHDANDAKDIMDWIVKQPWSNGEIGMMGGSYLGFSQWAAAKTKHKALKTIVPQVSVGIGIDYPLHNNVFMSYMLRWINYVTNDKYNDSKDFGDFKKWQKIYKEWYASGKSFRALDTIEGAPDTIFQRWLDHPAYDKFWQDMAVSEDEFSKVDIPVLTTTGYFDVDQRGAMHYLKEHLKRNKKANHYFVIGPYTHGGGQGRSAKKVGSYAIDSIAKNDMDVLAYQWFDYILKGKEKPEMLKDKINYQVMGADVWKHKPTLRAMNEDTLTFYFDNVRSGRYYKLNTTKPKQSEYIRQEIDFANRADTLDLFTPLFSSPTLSDKNDPYHHMAFVTSEFKEDIDINGSFIANLEVEINKKDMDVTMVLYEIQEDGKYFKLSEFLGRASYSKDKSKRQLLQPNQREVIPVRNSYFVSRRIKKGSKLLVWLGVNKSIDWQLNYGSGKDVSDETIEDAKEPLQIKWFANSTIGIPVSKVLN